MTMKSMAAMNMPRLPMSARRLKHELTCFVATRQSSAYHEEIAKLQKSKADEAKRAADYAKRASDAAQAAMRAGSASSAQSKLRDAERYEKDQQRAAQKVAELEKKIASEQTKAASAQSRLAKEEASVASKQQRAFNDSLKTQERRNDQIAGRLASATARHTEFNHRLRRLETLPERIVVLFLAANPLDKDQLRLDEEVRGIAETIRKSKHRDAVKLESCWAIRPQDVLQAINEHRPRIVHFSGHGTDQNEIVFQDDSGQSKLVTKGAIVQLMSACSGDIRLVFFNTCFSMAKLRVSYRRSMPPLEAAAYLGREIVRTARQWYPKKRLYPAVFVDDDMQRFLPHCRIRPPLQHRLVPMVS